MKVKGKNVFMCYLDLLGVRHTESFSSQYFNEHPHRYNLFGLSKMLSDYSVDNAAIEITDKENDLPAIKTPFIAHFGGDFAVVHKVASDNVSFVWKGANQVLTVAKFIESWTGIVLLAESSEKSIEPDYKEHRKVALLNLLKRIALFSACGLLILLAFFYHITHSITHPSASLRTGLFSYSSFGFAQDMVILLLNLSGLYISWLLLQKQLHIQSQYADKICSLFKQKDCNNVLERISLLITIVS